MDPNKLLVLWVEDDPNDVMLIRRAFKKASIQPVHVCANGEEAVQYLQGAAPFNDRARYPFPTLIVTDLKMPKVDGLDFLRWLRAHPQCRLLPVVVFSASAQSSDIEQCYQLGANGFFQKPIGLDQIVDVIGKILGYWREARPPVVPKKCS